MLFSAQTAQREIMIQSPPGSPPIEAPHNVVFEKLLETTKFFQVHFAVLPVQEGHFTLDQTRVGKTPYFFALVCAKVSGKLCQYTFSSHEPITIEHLPKLIQEKLKEAGPRDSEC